jgi:signal transduction histidine kinase
MNPAIAPTGTVKRLRWLVVIAAAAPVALFIALAWHGYGRTLEQSRVALLQMSRIVQEHATKVFQANSTLADGAVDLRSTQDYFTRFYKEVTGEDTDFTIALFRSDGEMIARYPLADAGPQNYRADGPLLVAISEGATEGAVNGYAMSGDNYRLAAFRQVAPYPVYVAVSRASRSVLAEWRHDLATLAAFVVPTWLALVLAAFLALKRARSEHDAIVHWHEETNRRAAAEEQLRQLQKYEALGELTGGLAHDFNNLLHIVSTNAAAMSLLPRGTDMRPYLGAMKRAVTAGAELTRHLLGFAKKQQLSFVQIDTMNLLPAICDMARHSLPKSIRLERKIADGVHDIIADATELELAIINLIVNARDAMPDGGVITVRAHNELFEKTSTVGTLAAGDYVAISVSDTGTGIAEAALERVFEPFFTTKKSKGTGLGLSRVYGYALQLGGTATARNCATGGAVVTLYIPRARQQPAQVSGVTEPDSARDDVSLRIVCKARVPVTDVKEASVLDA